MAGLALWVGFWGYVLPARVAIAIPWPVPPLHARFLGAMYLSARLHDRLPPGQPLGRGWGGAVDGGRLDGHLGIVSLLHLGEFDFGRSQSWVWFAAYGTFPVIAFWLAWRMRGVDGGGDRPLDGAALPRWVSRYLRAQGIAVTLLALALLLAPTAMSSLWPWAITPLLAQLYGAPFLSYGIGSLLLARETHWPPQRIAVGAMRIFVALVLLASLMHRALFAATDLPDLLWFGAFGVALVALSMILGGRTTGDDGRRITAVGRHEPRWRPRRGHRRLARHRRGDGPRLRPGGGAGDLAGPFGGGRHAGRRDRSGGGQAQALRVDLTDAGAVARRPGRILANGPVDVLVNNAGAGRFLSVAETPPEEAVAMMASPYFAAYHATYAFLPGMLAQEARAYRQHHLAGVAHPLAGGHGLHRRALGHARVHRGPAGGPGRHGGGGDAGHAGQGIQRVLCQQPRQRDAPAAHRTAHPHRHPRGGGRGHRPSACAVIGRMSCCPGVLRLLFAVHSLLPWPVEALMVRTGWRQPEAGG